MGLSRGQGQVWEKGLVRESGESGVFIASYQPDRYPLPSATVTGKKDNIK